MVAEGMTAAIGEGLGGAVGGVVTTINNAIEAFNQSEVGQSLLTQIHDLSDKAERCVAKTVDFEISGSHIEDEAGSSLGKGVAQGIVTPLKGVEAVVDFTQSLTNDDAREVPADQLEI